MAEVTKYPVEHQMGCGFVGRIFRRRQKTLIQSLPTATSINVLKLPVTDTPMKPPAHDSKRQGSDDFSSKLNKSHSRNQKNEGRRHSDIARSSTSSSSTSGETKVLRTNETKQRKDSVNNSRELSRAIATIGHKKSNEGKALVRATSSNIMLPGHLGNLRQLGNGNINNSANSTAKILENLPETNPTLRGRNSFGSNGVMGNIIRQPSGEFRQYQGLVTKMDPETLKNMGNEKYKRGRFEEALALYDKAIVLDPGKATYRCNRSAALIGLGHLMEAAEECKEAIRLDASYQRAHHRLASLYVRMGEAEKALHHYKHLGPNANSKDIAQAQALQKYINKCVETRKLQEWNTLLKETENAISSGADSAPQVYAMQAEAFLRLHKYQEAYAAYQRGSRFCVNSCGKFICLESTSHMLMIGAQLHMSAGRFEDAVGAAEQALRLDPSSKEVIRVAKNVKAVKSARLSGNLLFKALKFSEACVAYNEGLEHDPYNPILLCNRAACRSKLGQFEKAVEDCNAALSLQPNYSKARLRRADSNAKLGRWEASIQDYEMLIRESPADEDLGRALFETKVQLKKQRGEDIKDLEFGSNLVFISSNERFRHFVTSPGMSVVLFCKKAYHKQLLQLMERVCKRFPSVNFLKVEIEDHPYLVKSENVTSLPMFRIYRNGLKVKDIPGNNGELLEELVKLYSS